MAQCLLYYPVRTLDQVTSEDKQVKNPRGLQMHKFILLAMVAAAFLATLPPGGKAGW